ncbi:tyrosine-type recombinase/integrase [Paraburkholderia sp. BR10882]|uniref:tyrosine-type recombinase/integrase n=1 Tax=unclassified Paraburkholderia TaxID=2615204 RepID=UPI0034CD8258
MRTIHRLTAAAIRKLISDPPPKPRYYPDGAGLHLQVRPTGSASWVLKYQLHNRSRELGLGRWPDVGLTDARDRAAEARKLRSAGVDPLDRKEHKRKVERRAEAKRITFADAAAEFIRLREPEWSANTLRSWRDSIKLHTTAKLGRTDVAEIGTADVLQVLEPVWRDRYATARQLRQRIENILDWAASRGSREGLNPARYDGHLEHLLPKPQDKAEHHAALEWKAMPDFMRRLRGVPGDLSACLQFITLTGARSIEATGATWGEIDFEACAWHVPAERMKMRRPHDVPLSDAAIKLLKALPGEHGPDDRIFNSTRGKQISGGVLRDLLIEIGYAKGSMSVHGTRSALRTWATEREKIQERVAEALIAHDTRSGVQKTYERTAFYDERVPVMQTWAHFLEGGNVVQFDDAKKSARKRAASKAA